MERNIIPNDVIGEILLRLPVKSLLRLRWACKYWFDLITKDDDFIKMHFHHSTTTHNNNNEILSTTTTTTVLITSFGNTIYHNETFQCYLNYNNATGVADVSSEVISLDLHPLLLGCLFEVVGSCNGLILLHQIMFYSLCIWNPCTKEYRILPDPLDIEGIPYRGRWTYGFGYDHTNNDYKVIRATYYSTVKTEEEKDLHSNVQVYTLGTNSWRRIEPNPYRLFTGEGKAQGVFVNGILYWLDEFRKNIICFDFQTENFQHVGRMPEVKVCFLRIQPFEGSLCLVLSIKDYPDSWVEIWVMNDYAINNNNNKAVWTKLTSIPALSYIWPLKFTGNGEILMFNDWGDLVLYDQKTSNAETLCEDISREGRFGIEVYTESLVSLNSGTYS